MDEFGREPCPMRIFEDLGGAFAMGLIGGGIFQSIKGFRNAPVGFNRRFHVSLNNFILLFYFIRGSFKLILTRVYTLLIDTHNTNDLSNQNYFKQ